jgi:hypothetical protein
MWAQQPRFADLAAFRRAVAGLGYGAIEVSHSTDEAGLEALMREGEVPLTSLHAPTPRRRLPDGRVNNEANLASPDEAERRLAVDETKRTLDFAGRAGLRIVVVHLGSVGDVVTEPEMQLRAAYAEGRPDESAMDELRDELRRWRAERIGAHIEAARRSLRELAEHAAPLGVASASSTATPGYRASGRARSAPTCTTSTASSTTARRGRATSIGPTSPPACRRTLCASSRSTSASRTTPWPAALITSGSAAS